MGHGKNNGGRKLYEPSSACDGVNESRQGGEKTEYDRLQQSTSR